VHMIDTTRTYDRMRARGNPVTQPYGVMNIKCGKQSFS